MGNKKEMKKLYYVKREVFARSITEAMREKGRIYEISLAGEKEQPENFKSIQGFKQ